jgi:hypothetical protein
MMDETVRRVSKKLRVASWPFLVAMVALLLAILRGWPSEYYELLRFLVCGVAIYGAFQAYKERRIAWLGSLVGMAVLFNPLAQIHLSKGTWALLDLLAAALLGVFSIEVQLGPNTTKTPFYRRLAYWLDQDVSDPKETPYVLTRYERFTNRMANTIGFAVLAALLGTTAYGFIDIYIFHWEYVQWWRWLLIPLPFILWLIDQQSSD